MWKSQQNQTELIFTAGLGADVTDDPAGAELKNTLRGEGVVWEPWDELVTFPWTSLQPAAITNILDSLKPLSTLTFSLVW